MLGIGKEISIFFAACLAGNLVALVYCAIRVFRRIVRHSLFWISMEDLVYWVAVGLYLFTEMYRTCNGAIRWYFVIGVFLGGFLTLKLFQKLKKALINQGKKGKMLL